MKRHVSDKIYHDILEEYFWLPQEQASVPAEQTPLFLHQAGDLDLISHLAGRYGLSHDETEFLLQAAVEEVRL
jgi:hypothetical protein